MSVFNAKPDEAFSDITIGNTTLIAPSSTSRTYTLPDVKEDSTFVLENSMPRIFSLTDWSFERGFVTSTALDTDLYTVPAGKRAFISTFSLRNPTGTAITYSLNVVNGALPIRRINASTAVSGGGNRNITSPVIVLDSGDTFRCTNTGVVGMVIAWSLVLFNDTVPFRSIWGQVTTTPSTYTAPSNVYGIGGAGFQGAGLNVTVCSITTASITTTVTINGIVAGSVVNATGQQQSLTGIQYLKAGDVMTVTGSITAADQNFWFLTVYEQ